MKSTRAFALGFYAPILVSIFLMLVIVVSPKFVSTSPDIMMRAEVSVLGLKVPMPLWLDRIWLLRGVLVAASIVSFLHALTIDLTRYFPTRLDMDVYFDLKGIERCLNRFSEGELADVSLKRDWKPHTSQYDETVKTSLGALWSKRAQRDVPDIADFSRDLVHARGSTTFHIKRVGLFRYRVTESSGRLDYDWDIARKPKRTFCTIFELRESPANYLSAHFQKLMRSPYVILRPEFKQIFSIEAGGKYEGFDHIVIGLTKVFLLPFPQFSDTVYLWKLPDGSTVPIAYCVYIPENAI